MMRAHVRAALAASECRASSAFSDSSVRESAAASAACVAAGKRHDATLHAGSTAQAMQRALSVW